MGSTVDAVHNHLDNDPALADVLVRDIANLRKTARWMIAEHGWDDATEEAVVSALRRFRDERDRTSVWADRSALLRGGLEFRDGLALVTVPRTPEIQRAGIEAWFDEDGTGVLGVLPGRTETRLLVQERAVRHLSQELGPRGIEKVEAPVAVLRLLLPHDGDHAGLLSLVLGAFAQRGIPILEVVSCRPGWLFVVPDQVTLRAHEVLVELTGEGPG